MQEELPIMIEGTRAGYRATSPFYPKLSGQGRTQDDAVQALIGAIERAKQRTRPTTPLVTHVEITSRKK
ncbi:MAG: hypothetical protein R2873_24675 [Caldilineaceae bacterium]